MISQPSSVGITEQEGTSLKSNALGALVDSFFYFWAGNLLRVIFKLFLDDLLQNTFDLDRIGFGGSTISVLRKGNDDPLGVSFLLLLDFLSQYFLNKVSNRIRTLSPIFLGEIVQVGFSVFWMTLQVPRIGIMVE